MRRQILSILTILAIISSVFAPATVFADDAISVSDLCEDGGEHEFTDWIPYEIQVQPPATSVYPNPPELDTTYDITVARICEKCGKVFETAKEYKVEHAPTCQEQGYTKYTDRFGNTTTSDIIEAGPDYHSFGPVISLGTTSETRDDGITVVMEQVGRICVFCHEEDAHNTRVRKVTKPATCTEDGFEKIIDEDGHETHTDIPSEGHKWGRSSKTETTYDESKEMTTEKTRSICETCGELRTYTHCIWHEQPTCTETGKWYESYYDDGWDVGGMIHILKEEPVAGHTWSAWETSVNPTTEKEGEKTRECAVCHEKETEAIPKLKKEISVDNEDKQLEATEKEPAQQGTTEQTQKSVKETVKPTTSTEKPTTTTSKKKAIKVKKVKLSKKKVTIKKGKTYKIKATVSPKNATNKKLTYKSSNKKIATVSKTGKIKARKKGRCTITVTSKDGKKKAKLKVTVK